MGRPSHVKQRTLPKPPSPMSAPRVISSGFMRCIPAGGPLGTRLISLRVPCACCAALSGDSPVHEQTQTQPNIPKGQRKSRHVSNCPVVEIYEVSLRSDITQSSDHRLIESNRRIWCLCAPLGIGALPKGGPHATLFVVGVWRAAPLCTSSAAAMPPSGASTVACQPVPSAPDPL